MTTPALSPDQQQRLDILREDLEELREGADPSVPSPQLDDALLVSFVRADSAYATLPRKFLAACGYALRPPESIDDGEIRAELWRLIWTMAILRLLLEHTDHLSDRQLYERLYGVELMEPVNFQPGEEEGAIYVLDLLDSREPEDRRILLTHYADRLEAPQLKALKAKIPGSPPEPEAAPHDRDQFLP
ncbi:MAG: hypothetical protein AAFY88_18970 [Acidobacteriota bacterium]